MISARPLTPNPLLLGLSCTRARSHGPRRSCLLSFFLPRRSSFANRFPPSALTFARGDLKIFPDFFSCALFTRAVFSQGYFTWIFHGGSIRAVYGVSLELSVVIYRGAVPVPHFTWKLPIHSVEKALGLVVGLAKGS
jgi:hypothetical protein